MAAFHYGLILCFLLCTVSPAEGKEVTVTCRASGDCVLPCQFQSDGEGVRIMWFNEEVIVSCTRFGNTTFVVGKNLPADEYEGRTALYEDQVLKGNATLVLRNVKPKDEGKYICITYTASATVISGIISLVIKAPVGKVNIHQMENRITCSSEGLFPEPELTWSTSPSSNMNLQSTTTIHKTEQLLYNIQSFLIISDTGLSYSCTISTGRNKRRATVFKPTSMTGSNYETTIPCTAAKAPQTGLMWKFDYSQIILNQTRADASPTVSDGWRQHVKGVSESGSLMLKDLTPHHEGIYTCEASDAEETVITNTFLRIQQGPVLTCSVGGIIGAVVAAILLAAVAAAVSAGLVLRHVKKKGKQRNRNRNSNDNTQMETECQHFHFNT